MNTADCARSPDAAERVARAPWRVRARSSPMKSKILFVAIGLTAASIASPAWSQAKQKVMTITATEPMTTDNPYGESSSPVYSLWCHTYGCLGRYDYTNRKLVGILAEKWEAIDPDHLALHLAQGPQAPRRRSRTDIGRCRAHAQAHPHRPGKRAELVRRDGGGDRADRRPYLRRQDQGAGGQSGRWRCSTASSSRRRSSTPNTAARPTRSTRSAGAPTNSSSTRRTAAW